MLRTAKTDQHLVIEYEPRQDAAFANAELLHHNDGRPASLIPVSIQSQTRLKGSVVRRAHLTRRPATVAQVAGSQNLRPSETNPRVGPMEGLLGEVFAGRARPWCLPNYSSSSDKCGELGSYSGFLRI